MAAAGDGLSRAGLPRRLAAWGVHLLTASSGPAGLLALLAIARDDAPSAFWYMAWALAVDAVDGTLARAVGVRTVVPTIDGARLDDLMDYVTYVVVPAFFIVTLKLVPEAAAVPVASAIMFASGYGFAQTEAKTTDYFFTGFPSYWNIIVFYLWVLGLPPVANALILTAFAALVFVPLRYLYPSRMTRLRAPTVGLGLVWAAVLLYAMLDITRASHTLIVASLAYPAYYFLLSFVLGRR